MIAVRQSGTHDDEIRIRANREQEFLLLGGVVA